MKTNIYEVADLNLACFLSIQGHDLLDIKPQNDHAVFVFALSDTLKKDVLAFYNRKALVEPLSYSEVLRNFKAAARRA